MSDIVAVIVTHNNVETIVVCLESLFTQHSEQKTIVVDCASTDTTVEIIKKKFPQVIMYEIENRGYVGGNNFGIEKALVNNPEYILILNPDTQLFPEMLSALTKAAELQKGIFGPLIFKDAEKKTIWCSAGMLDPVRYSSKLAGYNVPTPKELMRSPLQGHFLSGTCLLLPTAMLKTGLRFYEPYFMYYEDVELGVRAAKLGYPPYCVPAAHLAHLESSSKTPGPGKQYYLARNHMLFVERNAPFRVQLHEILRLPKTVVEYFSQPNPRALRGIRDYLLRRFGPYDRSTQKRRPQTETGT